MKSPVKVLIYSSKEIYETSDYEGRAESDLIAYRDGDVYNIVKSKIPCIYTFTTYHYYILSRYIELEEQKRLI